jgi:hypothetical protein
VGFDILMVRFTSLNDVPTRDIIHAVGQVAVFSEWSVDYSSKQKFQKVLYL